MTQAQVNVVVGTVVGGAAAWMVAYYVVGQQTERVCEHVNDLVYLIDPWPKINLLDDPVLLLEANERQRHAESELWNSLADKSQAPPNACGDRRFGLLCEDSLSRLRNRIEDSCG